MEVPMKFASRVLPLALLVLAFALPSQAQTGTILGEVIDFDGSPLAGAVMLIERQDTPRYRITYFFDDHGKITGYMISAADPDHKAPPSVTRFDEFEAWVEANHPDEWDYLRPGGSLDPTGDRASRTRTLINQWRLSVGLPMIE